MAIHKNDKDLQNNLIKSEWLKKLCNILKYIIKICEENDLRYYACGGTAIGAVRHQGFIPWDDDIDIMMPRNDYDKFIKITSNNNNSKYKTFYPKINSEFYTPFAKVIDTTTTLLETEDLRFISGGFVDIFPIDGCPQDEVVAKKLFYQYHYYCYYWSLTHYHHNIKYYVDLIKSCKWKDLTTQVFCHVFSKAIRSFCLKKMHAIESTTDYDSSEYIITWCGSYNCENEIHKKKWMGKGKLFRFEDMMISLPEDYDNYLKCMFGDYMKLPPQEQRTTHHSVAYFNLNERETLKQVLKKFHQKC